MQNYNYWSVLIKSVWNALISTYAFTVLVLLHIILKNLGGGGGGGILAFYHVDTDVRIYSICAFLTVKWIFDVDNVQRRELIFFLKWGIPLFKLLLLNTVQHWLFSNDNISVGYKTVLHKNWLDKSVSSIKNVLNESGMFII